MYTISVVAVPLALTLWRYFWLHAGIPPASARASAGSRPMLHSRRPAAGRAPGGHLEGAFINPMSPRTPYDVTDGRPAPGRPPWDVFPMSEMTPDVGEILTAQLKAPDVLPMPHRCPIFSRRPGGHPTAAGRCPPKTHREDIGSSSGVNCDRSITRGPMDYGNRHVPRLDLHYAAPTMSSNVKNAKATRIN